MVTMQPFAFYLIRTWAVVQTKRILWIIIKIAIFYGSFDFEISELVVHELPQWLLIL